jgi:hypothetical protein
MSKKFTITAILAGIMILILGYIFLVEEGKVEQEEVEKQIIKQDVISDLVKISFTPMYDMSFALERDQEYGWILADPYRYRIDRTKVQELEENLKNLVTEELVEKDALDLAKYGLNQPFSEIIFTYTDQEKSLKIGEESFDGTYRYVMMDESADIYFVSNMVISPFLVTIDQVQDKHIVELNANKIDLIEFSSEEKGAFTLQKDQEEKWSFLSIEELVNQEMVTGFINQITNIQADSILMDSESKDLDFSTAIDYITLRTDDKEIKINSMLEASDESSVLIKVEMQQSDDLAGGEVGGLMKPWDFIMRVAKNKYDSVYKESTYFFDTLESSNLDSIE